MTQFDMYRANSTVRITGAPGRKDRVLLPPPVGVTFIRPLRRPHILEFPTSVGEIKVTRTLAAALRSDRQIDMPYLLERI